MNDTQWHALLGLFDPELYLKIVNGETVNDYTDTMTVQAKTKMNTTKGTDSTVTLKAGTTNPNQMFYDNADALADYLVHTIKIKPYDLNFEDKIMSPASGLTITAVTVQGKLDGTDEWLDVITWESADFATADEEGYYGIVTTHPDNWPTLGFDGADMCVTTNSQVYVNLLNCTAAVATRFDTHVHDDGTFCTSENAAYNQQTGKFEKNPNDGRAKVGVVMGGGGSGMDIDGDAETSIPWRYTAYEVRGHVNGNVGGEIHVGNTDKSTMGFQEGSKVAVWYRARGGYRLTALRVDTTDHNTADELEEHATSWVFEDLDSEHDVYVTFTSYFGDTYSSSAE